MIMITSIIIIMMIASMKKKERKTQDPLPPKEKERTKGKRKRGGGGGRSGSGVWASGRWAPAIGSAPDRNSSRSESLLTSLIKSLRARAFASGISRAGRRRSSGG